MPVPVLLDAAVLDGERSSTLLDGELDGLRSDAMLRPRYVNRVMTAPGSLLTTSRSPPTGSHNSAASRTALAIVLEGISWVMLMSR